MDIYKQNYFSKKLGVIETIEDTNMSAKTISNATPQLSGTLPEAVRPVVIMNPIMPVRLNVAGKGSMEKLLGTGL